MKCHPCLLIFSFIISCSTKKIPSDTMPGIHFDTQGHRGCRGLMPENTIPAFLKALDLGVNTLELLPLNAPMDYPPVVANIDLTLSSGTSTAPTAPTNLRIRS